MQRGPGLRMDQQVTSGTMSIESPGDLRYFQFTDQLNEAIRIDARAQPEAIRVHGEARGVRLPLSPSPSRIASLTSAFRLFPVRWVSPARRSATSASSVSVVLIEASCCSHFVPSRCTMGLAERSCSGVVTVAGVAFTEMDVYDS